MGSDRSNQQKCICMHALTDYIYVSFDESKYALGISIDLSKVFDSLNSEELF